MKKIIFTFFLLLAVTAQAQYYSPEYFNWHFGNHAAVTFKTPDLEPISYRNSAMKTNEGCSSISDMDTNLLFYTDGVTVWNRYNNVMSNGLGLKGNISSTQSAMIIKKPGNENLYYIFNVGVAGEHKDDNFRYSIVDMNANSGAGEVIEKNIQIHNKMVDEKQTAIKHKNGEDYWLIAHEAKSDTFVIALLTKNGIESVKTQKIGPDYYKKFPEGSVFIGQMKSSIRGDRIAAVALSANELQLYKFDRDKGIMSDYLPISLGDSSESNYGVEFSPSGRYVYTLRGSIRQFDINVYNKIKIEQSRKVFPGNSKYKQGGSMQLAPNGKIYMAFVESPYLSVINKPDLEGAACEIQFNSIKLIEGSTIYGLPNYCVTGPFKSVVELHSDDVCEGDDIEIEAEVIPYDSNYTYKWTGPNGFTSNAKKIKVEKAKLIHQGYYVVEISQLGVLKMKDSIYIKVHPLPKVKIIGPKTICPPDDVYLRVDTFNFDMQYFWSTGTKGAGTWVTKPGLYYVIAISSFGCIDTAYFELELGNLDVEILGILGICENSFTTLTANRRKALDGKNYSYLWSTGDTTESIIVTEVGEYSLQIIREVGCVGYDTVRVINAPTPEIELSHSGVVSICPGNSFVLSAINRDFSPKYVWHDGVVGSSRVVTTIGKYKLYVTNKYQCTDSAEVEVIFGDTPEVNVEYSNDLNICRGDSVVVTVNFDTQNNTILWEDGNTDVARTIYNSGKHQFVVSDKNGCSDTTEFEIKVFDIEKPEIIADKIYVCELGSPVTLTANQEYHEYLWSNGATTQSTVIDKAGVYRLHVYNEIGCSDSAEIEIFVMLIEKPEIIADKIYVCEVGTPVTLAANQEYHEYLWSNGATTQSTIVDKQGIYKLLVRNEIGCTDSTEIEIFVMPIEKPEIIGSKYFICENDTLTLRANGDYASYLWQDGSTNSSIIVRKSGTYKVIVTNEIGCIDSAEIFIDAIHAEFEFTQSNYEGEVKCTGEESTISLNLRNLTPYPTIINELNLENQIDFRIISPTLPFTLAANETREIIIAVNSLVTGMFETSIKAISQEPCYFETSTNLSQKFISNISMRLPEINAVAGEQLCIPIYGKINCGASPFVSSASIQISFDAEYFHVNSLKSGTNFTKVIENGICTVTIDYTSLNLTETETLIDELCGVALIGRPEKIPLSLSSDDWANDFIKIESVAGSLKLEACAIEVRGIKYFTPTAMTVSPLPANENLQVTINSGSIGTFELILVGFDGSQEVLRTWENTQTSSVDLLLDVSTLSQGVYSLLLKAPWSIHYQQILILR